MKSARSRAARSRSARSARSARSRSARSRAARSRAARSRAARSSSGGGVLSGVVSALKTALPSIVLYEALKMQGKRVKTRKNKSRRRRR
tara:strand:+ start:221 stop:487 length:267 start_codon:yes stop_codon:yes gene_type:complete